MKKYRLIQLITGIHHIHHFDYSYGFKLPFLDVAYFEKYGWRKINIPNLKDKNGNKINKAYHNCTKTGTC
jgi:hypothetical protein